MRQIVGIIALVTMLWGSEELVVDGEYLGELSMGSSSMVDANTTLHRDARGRLYGSYRFVDRGGISEGDLVGCYWKNTTTLQCQWSDHYGTGPLEMFFDRFGESFHGYWGSGIKNGRLPWNGRRKSNED